MPSFNKVVIMGNLTRDPEIKYLASGKAVCEFSLAVNEQWTDRESGQKKEIVAFIGCVIWGRGAEVVGEYCQKGTCLLIEGKLTQETWEDKETQKKREKTKVRVEEFKFVSGTKQKEAQEARQRPERPARPAAPAPEPDDDDIPF